MGIILLFMVVAALFFCLVATAGAGVLVAISLYLVRHHDPAWRWPGAGLLLIYGGVLLCWYWRARRSDGDVPEGLRELWRQVESVTMLWPLIPATAALVGAGVVLLVRG
jgi:hypothetical protein